MFYLLPNESWTMGLHILFLSVITLSNVAVWPWVHVYYTTKPRQSPKNVIFRNFDAILWHQLIKLYKILWATKFSFCANFSTYFLASSIKKKQFLRHKNRKGRFCTNPAKMLHAIHILQLQNVCALASIE